jgi:hypothetical protein
VNTAFVPPNGIVRVSALVGCMAAAVSSSADPAGAPSPSATATLVPRTIQTVVAPAPQPGSPGAAAPSASAAREGPVLAPPPSPPPPPASPAFVPFAPGTPTVTRGTVALASAGLSLAGAGAAVVFGVLALQNKRDFDRNPTYASSDKGNNDAAYADGSAALAVSAGITSLLLWLTRDSAVVEPVPSARAKHSAKVSPSLVVTSHGGGAGALVRF